MNLKRIISFSATIICILSFILHSNLNGQTKESIDLNTVLSGAFTGIEYPMLNAANRTLMEMNYNLPLLEKIEFRTETDRMTFGRQEFLLRTSFNDPRLKRAITEKRNSFLSVRNIENLSVTREKLYEKYKILLKWMDLKKQMNIITASQKLIQNQLDVYESMLSAGMQTDLSDYLKARKNSLSTEQAKQQVESEITTIKESLQLNTEIELSESDIVVRVQDVLSIILSLNPEYERHYAIIEKNAAIQYLESGFRLESIKAKKILDFVQARYTVREDLLFENRFSISLGLQLPWRGSAQIEKNDIKTKQIEIQTDKELIKLDLERKYKDLLTDLELKYKFYQDLTALEVDPEIIQLRDKILNSGRLDPIRMLKIKESELELEKDKIKVTHEILTIYIELLHTSGVLYQAPYKNYLSPLLPPISG